MYQRPDWWRRRHRSPRSARLNWPADAAPQPCIANASLRQVVRGVFFAAGERPLWRCGFAGESWPVAFPAAGCGRRLAAGPGRSSSLRCGRSTWACGFAGGRGAATGERPSLPRSPSGGAVLPAPVVVWLRDPGVACPKSRCLGCEPAALETEPFPVCPPGPPVRPAARWASACRRAKIASLTCRFSERRASFGVLPSASFLS